MKRSVVRSLGVLMASLLTVSSLVMPVNAAEYEETIEIIDEAALDNSDEAEVGAYEEEEDILIEDASPLGESSGLLDNGMKYTITELSDGYIKVVIDATESEEKKLEEDFYYHDHPNKQIIEREKVAELELIGITELGEDALRTIDEKERGSGFLNLSKISLPDTLTTIGVCSLQGLGKVKRIVLPSSVRTIENAAFVCSPVLEEVVLNEGLETVGNDIFGSCDKMESVVIPESVKVTNTISAGEGLRTLSIPISAQIGDGSHKYSLNEYVTKVIFTKGTGEYNEKFNGLDGELYSHGYELVIGEGITSVPANLCESDSGLIKVTLSSTINHVCEDAFDRCDNLAEVIFAEGTGGDREITLDCGAFRSCEKLTTVEFAKDIKQINVDEQIFCFGGLRDVFFRHPQFLVYTEFGPYSLKQIFGNNDDIVNLHAYEYDYYTSLGNDTTTSIKRMVEKTNEVEKKTVYKFVPLGPAPKPVPVTGLSLSESSFVKYTDEVDDTTVLELKAYVSPKNATNPDIKFTTQNIEGDPLGVVTKSVSFNEEDGSYTIFIRFKGTAGKAQINVSTNDPNIEKQFSASCSITVKEKERASKPFTVVLSGDGYNYGDLVGLKTQTPGAQIFYVLDDKDETTALNSTNIVYDEKVGRYVSKDASVKEYKDAFVIGKDTSSTAFCLHSVAVKQGLVMSEIAEDWLQYPSEDVWGDIDEEDVKSEFNSDPAKLKDDKYKGIWAPKSQLQDENLVYTGKAITIPDLRVYYGTTRLESGMDYTLKYSANTNATESAVITVTLKGNYAGKKQLNFRIRKMPLPKEDMTYSTLQVNAKKDKSGSFSAQKPDPKVKIVSTGKVLKPGTDYVLSYKADTATAFGPSVSAPGVYSVKIQTAEKGNYEFSDLEYPDAIFCVSSDMISISKVTVSKIAAQKIENWADKGYVVTPEFSVKYKGKDLTAGTDGQYRYEFRDNAAAGTASLVLMGTGKADADGNKFNGTKTITFKISGITLNAKNTTVSGINATYSYTGQDIKPDYKLIFSGKELKENTDYEVIYPNAGHSKAGNVSMTFKAKGIYSGSLKKSFKILPVEAKKLVICDGAGYEWKENNEVFCYGKGGVTPEVQVLYTPSGSTKTVELKAGTDYTVSYANNKSVGNAGATKNQKRIGPSATIKFKGNYSGSKTVYFTINQADISSLSMLLTDIVESSSPNKYTQKIVITDYNGAVLTAGTDYDKNVAYTYDGDVTVKIKSGKGYKTENKVKGNPVLKTHIIPAGAVIRATVKGAKNYTGEISDTFMITQNSIKNLKFTVNSEKKFYYTGKAITPGKSDIKVQIKSGNKWKTLTTEEASQYYDIVSYKNNVNAGNAATITIKGRNGYAGTVTLKFKILKKDK
jgi:hypothetical protein